MYLTANVLKDTHKVTVQTETKFKESKHLLGNFYYHQLMIFFLQKIDEIIFDNVFAWKVIDISLKS